MAQTGLPRLGIRNRGMDHTRRDIDLAFEETRGAIGQRDEGTAMTVGVIGHHPPGFLKQPPAISAGGRHGAGAGQCQRSA